MVSGVDKPIQESPLIAASGSVTLLSPAKQNAILNSSQLVVGKQFQAKVATVLADGTYIVNVADIAARMQLPNSPQIGAQIPLTLISSSPRPTFLLNSSNVVEGKVVENPANTTSAIAILGTTKQLIDDFIQSGGAKGAPSAALYLQSGSAVTSANNAEAEPKLISLATLQNSTPTTLSSAGKLVDQLIQNTTAQSTTATLSKVPLLATPGTLMNTNDTAKALQSSVTSSGIFYESHLLQWAEGSRPITELMKEPQAKFSASPANLPNATSAQLDATNRTLNTIESTHSTVHTPPLTIPQQAAPLIQQQLQTMEQQRFLWNGELWPGQQIEWEVSRDHPKQQSAQPEQTWQSAVRFELPQLGAVSAQLQLTGTRLKLTVNTKDSSTTLTLQNHANELINALQSSGAQLDSLLIKTKNE